MTTESDKYLGEWYKLHYRMARMGFSWGMVPEKDCFKQYMTTSIVRLNRKQWKAINRATVRTGHLFNKFYHHICKHRKLIGLLGMPAVLSRACAQSADPGYFSLITRFDFIVNDQQIKLCEANTATPQGLPESHIANNILCEHYGFTSPNQIKEHLELMWSDYLSEHQGISDSEPLYCTTYKWFSEDYNTATFIGGCCRDGREIRFIPLEKIRVGETGVYDEDKNPIHLLYMLYPLEFLPFDKDSHGKEIGILLLDHIANNRIHLINPLSATIMQSKMILAMIWRLHETHSDVFTAQEHEDIDRYFLPAYAFDSRKSISDYQKKMGSTVVLKPVFGREGKGVKIISDKVEEYPVKADKWYINQPCIIQQFQELPSHQVKTWGGTVNGKVMYGSYLLGGRPSGLYLRADQRITGEDCLLLGVTLD
ncbi:glutathionylspermidine synthase family protein [Sporolactobacillus putidus]|uniref:Glutathionylspermidine synthase n=1 Tax=Sporolactobacillus putidus TaxID=492735 RepID=A0A917S145_9BACL|nr:glutathionylspermidine synthase family protein [Sporolactobacillus putidus]GGL47549.1 glutathionylspermidine synthase [Sporolactobacillus putidus]